MKLCVTRLPFISTVLAALAAALVPGVVGAQVALNGRVVDAAGAPIAGAVVTVDDGAGTATSDNRGEFLLPSLPPGRHRVLIAAAGYRSRAFAFVIATDAPAERSVGAIVLSALPGADTVVVHGVVVDGSTGDPVAGAAVAVGDGQVVADAFGRFQVETSRPTAGSRVGVTARRLGYEALAETLALPVNDAEVTVELQLQPVALELAEITVEGRRMTVPNHLRDFYRRRELARGTFFTAEEIERLNPMLVSDLLRRVPGIQVIGLDDTFEEPTYRFIRTALDCESANMFVDGVRVPSGSFGLLAQPDRIAGIEVYSGSSVTPVQFDTPLIDRRRQVTGCGAIVVWTKSPDMRVAGSSPVEVGAHLGRALDGSSGSGARLGVQLVVPLRPGWELKPGYTVIRDAGGPDRFGSGWEAFAALSGFPLGATSPWYVGGGLTITRPVFSTGAEIFPLGVAGLRMVVGRVRPFVELQFVNPVDPSDVVTNLYGGVAVRLGG